MGALKNLYVPYCYAAFNRRIDAVTPWATSVIRPFCGYASHEVTWRFRQRCAELAVPGFVRFCAASFVRTGTLPVNGERVECDGLCFEPDRTVTLSAGLFLRALIEFALHWLHALVVILFSLRLKQEDTTSITLVYGVGTENFVAEGNDARFLAYCRRGPISPLIQAEKLVVQSALPIASIEPAYARYHRFPLFAALRWRGLGPSAWLQGLVGHISAIASFGWAVMRCPSAVILGRDAAYHAAVVALNSVAGLEAVVLTNSNYSAQALWMWALPSRRYRTHMVWYSDNSAPIVYSDDPVDTPRPNFRFIKVDEMWVWTERSRKFLGELGCRAIYHVIGPILWYLPEGGRQPQNHDEIRIAVFDVTAKCADAESREGLTYNYYNTANMTRFIEDILCVCVEIKRVTGRRVKILLKQKRSYEPGTHDSEYCSLIKRISGPGQPVELMSRDANMYSLISGCDLTLVIPYSSPAHIAISLGCPAIYYDPTTTVQPVIAEHPLLTFVAGRENLVKTLSQSLGAGGRGVPSQQA